MLLLLMVARSLVAHTKVVLMRPECYCKLYRHTVLCASVNRQMHHLRFSIHRALYMFALFFERLTRQLI